MDFIANSMRHHQEIAIFLTLAIGYLLGKIKIGTFILGPQIGSLMAGIAISIWINANGGPIEIPSLIQNFFFSFFIFAMGFNIGPQFIQGLRGGALVQVVLTMIFCVVALLLTVGMAFIFSFDKGLAAGFMAGTFSQSAIVGSASEAINALSISAEQKNHLINNLAVAFAITNVIGVGAMPFMISKVCPLFLRGNLKEECKKKEQELSIPEKREPGVFSALTVGLVKTFIVSKEKFINKTVAELESFFPGRIYVERMRKENNIIDSGPETIIHKGDVLAISGFREEVFKIQEMIGEEVNDQDLLNLEVEELNIVVTKKDQLNKTLQDLRNESGRGFIRLVNMIRAGKEFPATLQTKVQRGDTLKVIGVKSRVEEAAKRLGYADRPSVETDISYIGIGLVIGGLIGIPAIVVGNVSIGLSTSVGILMLSIFLSWLRSTNPVFGKFPQPVIWFFQSVGLSIFLGIVGLTSGAHFIEGLLDNGLPIFISGMLIGGIPAIVSVLVGQYIFKLNMGINLGIAAGADTATPTINSLIREAGSNIPTLGFTIPYAIGNIVLTIWGPVIVAIVP